MAKMTTFPRVNSYPDRQTEWKSEKNAMRLCGRKQFTEWVILKFMNRKM